MGARGYRRHPSWRRLELCRHQDFDLGPDPQIGDPGSYWPTQVM